MIEVYTTIFTPDQLYIPHSMDRENIPLATWFAKEYVILILIIVLYKGVCNTGMVHSKRSTKQEEGTNNEKSKYQIKL
mgnify:CR=1 FL=1